MRRKQKHMTREEIANYIAARQEQEKAKAKERVITLAVRVLKCLGKGQFKVDGNYIKVTLWVRNDFDVKALQSALKEYGYFLATYDNDALLSYRYTFTLSLNEKDGRRDPYLS